MQHYFPGFPDYELWARPHTWACRPVEMTRHLSHLRTSSWSWGPGQQKGLLHVSENGVLNPPNNFLKKGKMTINHWPHLRHSVAGAEKARCRPCFGGLIHGFIWRWGTSNSNRLSSSSPLKWPFGGMPHFQTHARTQTHISCHIFLFIFSCTSWELSNSSWPDSARALQAKATPNILFHEGICVGQPARLFLFITEGLTSTGGSWSEVQDMRCEVIELRSHIILNDAEYVDGSKPCIPGESQNSWDLWSLSSSKWYL